MKTLDKRKINRERVRTCINFCKADTETTAPTKVTFIEA